MLSRLLRDPQFRVQTQEIESILCQNKIWRIQAKGYPMRCTYLRNVVVIYYFMDFCTVLLDIINSDKRQPDTTFLENYPQNSCIYSASTENKFSSVQLLSRVWLFATPWIAARQVSLSITNSRSSLKLTEHTSRLLGMLSTLLAQMVKRLPAMRETRVWSLGWEDPLEKKMAPYSSTLAWKIPWTEEPGRLQSMESQRVKQDWATSLHFTTTMS